MSHDPSKPETQRAAESSDPESNPTKPHGGQGVDYSEIIRSLISESAAMGDVLECSLELMEMFDPDDLVDCVYRHCQKSLDEQVRVWLIRDDGPRLMGKHPPAPPEDPEERNKLKGSVQNAFEQAKERTSIDGNDFLVQGHYVWEMISPDSDYPKMYVANLYFRHLTRGLEYVKDRLVLVKAYQEVRELMNLKSKVEGSLQDIQDQSNSSIAVISELLDGIITLSESIRSQSLAEEIQQLAYQAMNETQVGDLTNQKVFASLHNLDALFQRLSESLDPTSRGYLNTLYSPKSKASGSENVVSQSLLEGQQGADQSSVDDLLAELGL